MDVSFPLFEDLIMCFVDFWGKDCQHWFVTEYINDGYAWLWTLCGNCEKCLCMKMFGQ